MSPVEPALRSSDRRSAPYKEVMADGSRPESWSLALAGGLAATTALATSVFLDGTSESVPSLIHGIGQAIIRMTPGDLAREGIDAVGRNDKPLIIGGTVVIAIALGGRLGLASTRRRWLPAAGMAVAALLALVATVWATTATVGGTLITAVGSTLGGVAAFETLRAFAMPPRNHAGERSPAMPGTIQLAATRRRFLTTMGLTAAGAGAATLLGRRMQTSAAAEAVRSEVVLPPPAEPTPVTAPTGAELGLDGITPVVTANDRFYRIDEALVVPSVDLDGWTLEIRGMVDEPLTLTYDDLLAEDLVERYVTLSCVSNEVGGGLVGNAQWLGVPLARVLERVGVQPGADQLVARSVDGFSVGFPTEVALDGRDALIAIGMNGEPLPRDHGFPARLVVPGLYGYVSATKWLSSIELTTWDAFDAYWIERGWAKEGPVKTQSRIDVPRGTKPAGPVAVAGVAWAPNRGISEVEVRVDEGEWVPATLAEAISDDSWRQWHHTWDATSGRHQIEVRATDGEGDTQTGDRAPVYPDGAAGYHRIVVEIS
jgi:DMSO/TMAO reductase YedYZ molybdopterin-dependent catalytic subunit